MKRTDKQTIVQTIREKLEKAQVVISTDYKGLDVESMNALRRKLRESGSEYYVVKNTLLTLAAENTDAALIKEFFKGPTAVALNFDDPVAPAKVLNEFAKSNAKLEIKAGAMAGKALSLDDIKALADLPSREVLLAQLLSALNGVPTSFVRVLNGTLSNFMNVLVAVKDQKEKEAA